MEDVPRIHRDECVLLRAGTPLTEQQRRELADDLEQAGLRTIILPAEAKLEIEAVVSSQ